MKNCFGFLPSFSLKIVAAIALVTAAMGTARAIEVSVAGLRNGDGNVVICVWRKQDKGFPNCGAGQPFKKLTIPATAPSTTLDNLRPGEYAISIFHDEKKLGRLERNFFGAPTSGVGLANNPQFGPMNPPTFDKARVFLPSTQTLSIAVIYLLP